MITVERKAQNIVERMESRVASGESYPHLKAFGEIGKLALSRLFASARLKRVAKFSCDLCSRHRPHTHRDLSFMDAEPIEIRDLRHLQYVLNREFYGVFSVSSPRFGQTVNINYVGGHVYFDTTLELRYFLKNVCGLTLLNNKAAQRKAAATIKI